MARWDSADLLSTFRALVNRPVADEDLPDPLAYQLLTLGQDHWMPNLATHVPKALYGDPVQMVTADGGATYTIPNTAEIIGTIELRDAARGWIIPATEYILEGARVRFPFGRTRTFAGGAPWISYIATPGAIDAAAQPVLKPPSARILIVYHAAFLYGSRPPNPLDPEYFRGLETKAWNGDPAQPGALGILDTLKLQYAASDAEYEEGGGYGGWWHSPDLGGRSL